MSQNSSTVPLKGLVPMARVADVNRSIAFYEKLGFICGNKLEFCGNTQWAWLTSGSAHLMLSRSEAPLSAGERSVIMYLYSPDLTTFRDSVAAKGVKVSEITYPEYMQKGEFRIDDPDGYVLLVGQVDERTYTEQER